MNKLFIFLMTLCAASAAFAGGEPVQIKEVVVTASRYEESLTSVPANTSIISKEEIQFTPEIPNSPNKRRGD